MNRIRIAIVIFCIMLVTIIFNYIYVHSVRSDMLQQTEQLCLNYTAPTSPSLLVQTWKNRKWLLSLSEPLTVLDQIDIQLSVINACAVTQDSDAYLRACHHLKELLASLGG